VAGSTHEILGLCSLLVRVVGYKVDKHLNLRLGEETKGRQVEYHRMERVRGDKKIFAYVNYGPHRVGPCGTRIDYVLMHAGFMGPRKPISFWNCLVE
jgi:hypothetical protein